MSENELISTSRIHQIIGLIDLTNLNDDCNQVAIETLCAQAMTPVGHVAAVCIWPTFVSYAKNCLGQSSPVQIATVVNFPSGDESLELTCSTIDKALDDGATEIDYVLPYNALLNGKADLVVSAIKTVRNHIPDDFQLKIILETGELVTSDLIRTAAQIAIEQGADFIKTSTGKVPINATPEAATIMLDAIAQTHRDVGFKVAGGIKSIDDANAYLKLSEERLGQSWADPAHFRFGASSLLQDALVKLDVVNAQSSGDSEDY